MIDLHSHILPEMDDGSSSVEMSVAMLEAEAEQGISCVMATPHFYAHQDMPEDFLARRNKAYEKLLTATAGREDLPRVMLGAEVSYYIGMSESEILHDLCLGNSKYLLVEMPMFPWPEYVYMELQDLRKKQGITPVLAHIERYLAPFQTEKLLKRLEALPVLLQVNASFLLDKRSAKFAGKLLQKGRVHLLGSDCHDMQNRPPRLGQAVQEIREKLGGEALDRIFLYEKQIVSL